ncbi:MAG: hypothetical protein IJ391_08445 [Clostridia bacterium]|nr:hypothetical protein [Clostridia bacterium]
MKPTIKTETIKFLLVLATVVAAVMLSMYYVLIAPAGELAMRLIATAIILIQFFGLFVLYMPAVRTHPVISRWSPLAGLLSRVLTDLLFIFVYLECERSFSINFITRFYSQIEWYLLGLLIMALVFILFTRKTFYAGSIVVLAYYIYVICMTVNTLSYFQIAWSVVHLMWFASWTLSSADVLEERSLAWELFCKFMKTSFGEDVDEDEDLLKEDDQF